MQNNKGIAFFLRVGGSLLLIAAIVAGMLAVVNAMTAERIEQNSQAEINTAIGELFGGEVEKTDVECTVAGVRNVWRVAKDGADAGCCIYTETPGYGGTIGLMVGFDTAGSIIGINIVEISETPGLGSRVDSDEYLSQYIDGRETVTPIAGSTVSSRAVTEAVEIARNTYQSMNGGGADE